MRNISFALTTRQFVERRKTVTRRMGWKNAQAGEILQAVEKSQGLKKGQTVQKLDQIRVVSVRREPLVMLNNRTMYAWEEVYKEGFPDMSPPDFCAMFLRSHKGCSMDTELTRIEFEYMIADDPGAEHRVWGR